MAVLLSLILRAQKRGGMKTILVVDDEKMIRHIYATLLMAEGYHVIEAPGAVEADEILKHERIDLVLLDLRMPDVNGKILHDVMLMFHKKVKVIVSSVYNVDTQRKIIPFAAGYHDKSQGVEFLLEMIQAIFNQAPLPETILS